MMREQIKGWVEKGRASAISAQPKKRRRPGGFLQWLNRLVLLALGGFLLARWLRERQEQARPPVVMQEEGIPIDRYGSTRQEMEETSEQPRTTPLDFPGEAPGPNWPTPEVALSQAETAPVAVPTEPQTGEAARYHPADQAEEPVQTSPEGVEPSQPDDLTVLEGIGPKISSLLQEAGITTYRQLAGTDITRLEGILLDANLRMADPGTWPEQARLLSEGRRQEFQELIEKLKAGRRT